MKFRNNILRSAASGSPDGGGGQTTPPPAAVAGQTTPPPAPAAGQTPPPAPGDGQQPPASPSLVQSIVNGLRSKQALNTDIARLNGELSAARQEISDLRAENGRLLAENQRHTATLDELQKAVASLNSEASGTQQKAAAMLAAHGVAPAVLPPAAESAESAQSIQERLSKETDPRRRFILTQKLMEAEKLS